MQRLEDDDAVHRVDSPDCEDAAENKSSYSTKADIMPRSLAITIIVASLMGIAFWAVVAAVIVLRYR